MDDHTARILEPSYLDDLRSRSIEDVRAMRGECQAVETGLSFLRRLVQGRLDIVDAELVRRREGGDPADLSALIDQLPEILADHLRAPGNGRLPSSLSPGTPDAELASRLDALVTEFDLDAIGDLDDERLRSARDGLTDLEVEVSTRRRALFDRIDALQAELTRRYKSGEASVESLLK
jgi:hypothetical protein